MVVYDPSNRALWNSGTAGNPGAFLVLQDDGSLAWLQANAARYGFKNLKSEPWHWSTTGN